MSIRDNLMGPIVSIEPMPRPAKHPCKVCAKDMGFDRPSGVCSSHCLNQGQLFDTPATMGQPSADQVS